MGRSFRNRFLVAVGLPALTLGAVGCADRAGGGDSSASGSASGATWGTGGGTDTGPPVDPEICADPSSETAGPESGSFYTCVAVPTSGTCLDCPDDVACTEELGMQVQQTQGWCYGTIDQVLCTPEEPADGKCCYLVYAHDGCNDTAGRPFIIDGVPRVAPTVERGDWSTALEPSLAGLDPDTRRELAREWTRRGQDEHASVASFSRFVLDLLALGAPADLVARAQAAAADEVRHARVAFGLASAYAGRAVGPGPMDLSGALSPVSLVEAACAAVVEGCLGETLAAAIACREAAAADDPVLERVLLTIAEEELAHAELAWDFVDWAIRQGGPAVHEAVQATFEGAAPTDRDVVAERARDLSAHGILSPAERTALVREVWESVIEPGVQELSSLSDAGMPVTRRAADLTPPAR